MAQYYVSTSGNDTNPGTLVSPWRSIQHAVDTAIAGDTVHVAAGMYDQRNAADDIHGYHMIEGMTHSGTALAPIIFLSDTAHGAIIYAHGTKDIECAWYTNQDYIQWFGFEWRSDSYGLRTQGSYGRAQGNYFHDMPNVGILIAYNAPSYTNTHFDTIGNIFVNCGTLDGDQHPIYHSIAYGTIENNIVLGTHGFGIQAWGESTNIIISNNLISGAGNTNIHGGIALGAGDGDNLAVCDNCVVSNNIIMNVIDVPYNSAAIWTGGSLGTNNQFINNLISNCTSNYNMVAGTVTGTIFAAPQLVNYQDDGSGDYHLQATSPCINAGTATGAPSTDYDGRSRPQGSGYDIGPYEMSTSTLYGSSVADSILTTACLMTPLSGGVETSKQTTITGTGGTYAEITSQGSSVADVTALPGTPTGKGWIYYPGAGTFAAGNWSASLTLQFVLHGSPNQTTLRFFRRSGGVYTLIGSIVATTATLAKTTYTFAATSMAAITFGASDGLYIDLWWHDASSDPSGDNPTIYVSSSAGAGVTGDMQITTSAFSSAAGALAGTMAGHGTLSGTLAVTGVGKIAGQTFSNGISNFIFGAHDHGEPGMSVPYPTSAQITLAKQLGGPPMLLRTFFNDTATDAQITARLNAISDCGGIPLICLQTPTNATFNRHVVTFVGSGCNLYEFGNEPDGPNTPLSVAAYSAAWNAQIPTLRGLNTNASFLGCSASLGYTTTWLNNCHASGVKPDGVTIHDYPCHLDTTAAACLADDNLGAQVTSYRHTVESIFPGQNIAVGFTEWNVDWANPMVGYSQTEPFVSQFYQDVLQSFINANADYACVFSLFSGGSNFPMINTSTGAKTGFYTAFQHAVSALINVSTFALVQSATGSVGATNAASVTVPTKATGSGHLLVAFVMVQGASVTITPPGGWAQVDTTQGIAGGTGSVAMFYRQNSASGVTSHVFSFSASCNASVAFEEWSGVATSLALDQEVAKQNAKGTSSLTGTTGTLANPGELAIFGLAVPATNVLTYSGIANGYKEDTSANATSSQATRAEATLFYKTGTSSAATSSGATMSGTGAAGNTTILAVFRAAGTGIALSGECDGVGTLSGTLSLTGGTGMALSGECDGVGTLSGTLTVPPTIRGTYTVVIGGVLI